ncbi:MAG TPA: hypothetical protein VL625_09105 [Patescibacteria group bacterium]|nr:hypothetical protein [Patescibacteria group bacterium]
MCVLKKSFIVLAVLLSIVKPASAQTADACTPAKEALHQPEAQDFVQEELYNKRRQEMARLDGNCDGVIDLREWAIIITDIFQSGDFDHDNNLTPDEQHAMVDAYTAKTEKVIGSVKIVQSRELQTASRLMDVNKDGIVTIDEFIEFYDAVFKRMDKNGDNVISIDEFNGGFEGVRRIHN